MVHAPRTDAHLTALGGNGIDNYQGGEIMLFRYEVHMIGDGGHAKVVRDALERMSPVFDGKDYVFVAIGDNENRRKEVFAVLKDGVRKFVTIIHPDAVIGKNVKIGRGTVVMAGAIVQAEAIIGDHCILNSNSVVDHECLVHDYAHIAPGAVLCGNVTVGEGALIGAGAVCVPGAVIPPWSLVKAGTVAK